MKLAIALMLVIAPLLGCKQQSNVAESDVEALKSADAALSAAVAAKDADKIASYYAESAVLMPTAEPLISGRAAIAEEWKHIVAIPGFENASKLSRVEVSSSHDMAYTTGTYQSRLMGEDGKIAIEPGKWVTIWKKQPDGSWKIVLDTYNTDIMPPVHQPSEYSKPD